MLLQNGGGRNEHIGANFRAPHCTVQPSHRRTRGRPVRHYDKQVYIAVVPGSARCTRPEKNDAKRMYFFYDLVYDIAHDIVNACDS